MFERGVFLNKNNFQGLSLKLDSLNVIDPMRGINQRIKEINESSQVLVRQIGNKNSERVEREKRSLELQEESLEIQKLLLFLTQCLNKDNKEIIEKLQSLIDTVNFGNKINEGNLLIIEKELEKIKVCSENKQEKFISIATEKLAEKGVEFTIMFLLQGLKQMFMNG